MKPQDVDKIMEQIYKPFRYRWCKAKKCFCMGCVNVSGYPIHKGELSEEDHKRWVERQKKKNSDGISNE